MAIWPDQHRAIGVDAVSIMPVAIEIAEVAVTADRVADERRPRRADRLRGLPPCVAVAAGEQHEVRAEQVDGGDMLMAARQPDVRRAAAGPGGGQIVGDGIVDGDRWRA